MIIELDMLKAFLPTLAHDAAVKISDVLMKEGQLRAFQEEGLHLQCDTSFSLEGRLTTLKIVLKDSEAPTKDNVVVIGGHAFVVHHRSDAKDSTSAYEDNVCTAVIEMENVFSQRPGGHSTGSWLMQIYGPLARHYGVSKDDVLRRFIEANGPTLFNRDQT